MKKILSLFGVLVVAVLLVGCGGNGGGADGDLVSANVSIYDADGELLDSVELEAEEGNLFDALVASDAIEISYETSGFGSFITTINGVEAGLEYFWAFYINGEMAMVGPESHDIEDGDEFEFRLTNIND